MTRDIGRKYLFCFMADSSFILKISVRDAAPPLTPDHNVSRQQDALIGVKVPELLRGLPQQREHPGVQARSYSG